MKDYIALIENLEARNTGLTLEAAEAIRALLASSRKPVMVAGITVYFDGRDPEFDGVSYWLPRRERDILLLLASRAGRWVSKAQIADELYGIDGCDSQENSIETHICKLRKKLTGLAGANIIETSRHVGYRIVAVKAKEVAA